MIRIPIETTSTTVRRFASGLTRHSGWDWSLESSFSALLGTTPSVSGARAGWGGDPRAHVRSSTGSEEDSEPQGVQIVIAEKAR